MAKQTFDSYLNQFIEHDHDEYALKDEVASITDINQLQQILQGLTNRYNQLQGDNTSTKQYLSEVVTQHSEETQQAIKLITEHLLEQIQKRTLNLSEGILDAGTFNEPQNDIIIDAGGFSESPILIKEKKLSKDLTEYTDKRFEEARSSLKQNMDTLLDIYVFKDEFIKVITKIDLQLAKKLEQLPKHIHSEYALKQDLTKLALKEHEHKQYALKSSLDGVAKIKDIPQDYVPLKEFNKALNAIQRDEVKIDEGKIVADVLKHIKPSKVIEKTKVVDNKKLNELKRVFELERKIEKAPLGHKHKIPDVIGLQDALSTAGKVSSVNTRIGDVVLTSADVGLGNVDNTSDTDKPVSTAIQTALNLKQDSLGYTAEDSANKDTTTTLGTSDTKYPSQKAVKTYADTKVAKVGDTMTGPLNITSTSVQLPLVYNGSNSGAISINSAGRMIFTNTASIAVFDDSEFQISRPTGTNQGAFKIFQNNNPAQSFEFSSQGNMNWGDGSGGVDTFIYRKGAGLLQVDTEIWIGGFGVEDFRFGRYNGVFFNLQKRDMDMAFRGTTDENLIYTDAGNNRVGIGTASPSTKLDVNGTIHSTGYQSSDASAGISTTITTADLVGKTITVKDGIITGFT